MFCGGKNCKYEGTANWSEAQQAITGIYSNWYVKGPSICTLGCIECMRYRLLLLMFLSVSLSCAKLAAQIEVLFGVKTFGGPKNIVRQESQYLHGKGEVHLMHLMPNYFGLLFVIVVPLMHV